MIQTISVNITEKCNLRCKGCYSHKSEKTMSFKDYKLIMKKFPIKNIFVNITGGEPFLHKELYKIAEYTHSWFKSPIIFTSGTITNTKFLKKLKKVVLGFALTIKYPNNSLDSEFRGFKNSFEKSYYFYKKCKSLGIPVAIHFALDKGNIEYADKMYYLFGRELNIIRYLPYNKELEDLALSDKEWNRFCKKAKELYPKARIIFLSKYSEEKQCLAGLTRMNILVNGDVTPCVFIPNLVFGNLIKEDFVTVYNRMKNWRKKSILKDALFPKCKAIEVLRKNA